MILIKIDNYFFLMKIRIHIIIKICNSLSCTRRMSNVQRCGTWLLLGKNENDTHFDLATRILDRLRKNLVVSIAIVLSSLTDSPYSSNQL